MRGSPYSDFARGSRAARTAAARAFTLVELLVALALASLLLITLFSTWRAVTLATDRQLADDELRQTAAAVLERIAEDLRQAAPSHFPVPPLVAFAPSPDPTEAAPVLEIVTHAPLRAGGPPALERLGMTWVRYSLQPAGGGTRLLAMERRPAVYAPVPEEEDPVPDPDRYRVELPLPVREWDAAYRTPEGTWEPAWSDPADLPAAVRLRLVCGAPGPEPPVELERIVLLPAAPAPASERGEADMQGP